jgi:predicted nucleic-acid-binding protein
MIGIDTNVLVRFFIDDDHEQHLLSRRLFENTDIFISNVVLVESFWVLKRLYKLKKGQLESALVSLLRMSNTEFENNAVFPQALAKYQELGCDFGDALIDAIHRRAKVVTTASFDVKAIKKLGFSSPRELLAH